LSNITVGTCGVCGGPVCIPSAWYGINPPPKQCSVCGAIAKESYGPVLPMQERQYNLVETKTSTNTQRVEMRLDISVAHGVDLAVG